MALTPGSRLGVYEITAQIGEGGMGQVFRARDTKLNRDIALKVLPDSFANDADRLARFTREAQTLAALNHPNIAHIHGLEESGGVRALVMELVEGEDLSQRIARGAIPLDEALPIAKQIAEALEAAHEQGIIHRDLKPANVKVRPDGTVKVLDFGLAKALDQGSGIGDPFDFAQGRQGSGGAANSPTITSPAGTMAGMILGTAAYMSPEQAKGRPVDRRADVWAFGAVLYEMLTGARAFGGEGISDTLANVLKSEPEWSRLPADVSPPVRQVLRACLQKDSRQRMGDMQSVRLALGGAFETSPPQTTRPVASTSRGPLISIVAGVALVAATVLAIPALQHLRETPQPAPPETRLEIVTPATDNLASFALSPDGRQIAFVASGDGASRLWVRLLASTTAQPLAGTDGAVSPFWSPDSHSVGFFADGKLKRIDLGGGAAHTVAAATGARGGSWNADGVILFTPNSSSPMFRVPATGGSPAAVTTLDRQSSHRFPVFLPDGRHFLFYAKGSSDTEGIYLGALDAPETHRVTAADASGVYQSSGQTLLAARSASGPADALRDSGWLLWVRAGTLLAQRLDLDRQTLTGEPVTLADSVLIQRELNVAAVSVSAGGLVAYRTGVGSRRQFAWFNRSGKPLGLLGGPDENVSSPNVSPDGHRVAVFRAVQDNTDLWLLDGTRTSRVTFDAALDRYPIWSPDGSRIAFDSTRMGHRDLYQTSSSGAGAEELLLASQQDKIVDDWSADGRFLLYHVNYPETSFDLWVLPLEGDRMPRVFLKTSFEERNAAFSPDGRWVAYMSNESGRSEIYVRPFAGPSAAGGQSQISTTGGIFPRWRRDGKALELYYVRPNGDMMAAPIAVTGATLVPGAPVALFPTHISGGGLDNQQGRQYDVTRDGRFLINTVLNEATAPITLLMNWNPDAKK